MRLRSCAMALHVLVAFCSLAAERARADAPPPLGTAGQWMVGGRAGGSYEWREADDAARNPATIDVQQWSLWLAPSTSHFVATDLALGASFVLGADHSERSDGLEFDEIHYGGSALIAYRIGLGRRVFLLPELALGAVYVNRSARLTGAAASSETGAFERYQFVPLRRAYFEAFEQDTTALRALLTLPVAFSPTPGFFIGIGPYLHARYALSGVLALGAREWAVAAGISTVIGFWL
jgi:hypothetical protein